jgi:hypothetical protein
MLARRPDVATDQILLLLARLSASTLVSGWLFPLNTCLQSPSRAAFSCLRLSPPIDCALSGPSDNTRMPRKSEAVQGPDVHLEPLIEQALIRLQHQMPPSLYLAPYEPVDIFRPLSSEELDRAVAKWRDDNAPDPRSLLQHELRASRRVTFVANRIHANLQHAADEIAIGSQPLRGGPPDAERIGKARQYIRSVLDDFAPKYQTAIRHVAIKMRDPHLIEGLEGMWRLDYARFR